MPPPVTDPYANIDFDPFEVQWPRPLPEEYVARLERITSQPKVTFDKAQAKVKTEETIPTSLAATTSAQAQGWTSTCGSTSTAPISSPPAERKHARCASLPPDSDSDKKRVLKKSHLSPAAKREQFLAGPPTHTSQYLFIARENAAPFALGRKSSQDPWSAEDANARWIETGRIDEAAYLVEVQVRAMTQLNVEVNTGASGVGVRIEMSEEGVSGEGGEQGEGDLKATSLSPPPHGADECDSDSPEGLVFVDMGARSTIVAQAQASARAKARAKGDDKAERAERAEKAGKGAHAVKVKTETGAHPHDTAEGSGDPTAVRPFRAPHFSLGSGKGGKGWTGAQERALWASQVKNGEGKNWKGVADAVSAVGPSKTINECRWKWGREKMKVFGRKKL